MTVLPSPFSRQTFMDYEKERVAYSRSIGARSDVAIEEEIWNGIFQDRSLGPKYQENIDVDVEHGRVNLRGYILKPWHSPLVANIISRVEGVRLIKNELVADNVVQNQVIQALLKNELTSPYIFTVKSSFGWVHLSGVVPSREITKAAETVVGFVPAVRGVLSLPSVFGETWLTTDDTELIRRTLQPRLAALVYQDADGPKPVEVGLVSQVVIDPSNRLVSAIAVRVSGNHAEKHEAIERMIPISEMEAVSKMRVWLKEGKTVDEFTPFDRKQFLYTPQGWQPPFPYLPGMVRWAL